MIKVIGNGLLIIIGIILTIGFWSLGFFSTFLGVLYLPEIVKILANYHLPLIFNYLLSLAILTNSIFWVYSGIYLIKNIIEGLIKENELAIPTKSKEDKKC